MVMPNHVIKALFKLIKGQLVKRNLIFFVKLLFCNIFDFNEKPWWAN
jgi:hypothetical protein